MAESSVTDTPESNAAKGHFAKAVEEAKAGGKALAETGIKFDIAFTSALTRNQVVSFILSAVIGLFLLLAGYPPVTDLLSAVAPPWLVAVVSGFSFTNHFEQLQRGVVDLRDLLYFASVIVFMLFATHLTLENRKSK